MFSGDVDPVRHQTRHNTKRAESTQGETALSVGESRLRVELILAVSRRGLDKAARSRYGCERRREVFGAIDAAHPLAAASGHRLDEYGKADACGFLQ